MNPADTTILVTGATRDIGRAFTHQLIELDALFVAAGRERG